jgi:DNA-binding CsgD family transcriptional regulator
MARVQTAGPDTARSAVTWSAMIDTSAPQRDERQGDSRPAGHLVGRDAELGRLRAFLGTAGTHGGALLVTGEPGVGKTGLLDAAADDASSAGTRVLHAAGIQFEAGMSFSGLNQVLLPLVDELLQLPAVHRDALNVALGFGEGAPPSRLVVSNAALVLLRTAAIAQPLLLLLDDLPWLDRASAGVLSFVARRLDGSKVGLIGASRTGEEDFFDHAGLPELVVEPLDEAASRQLLETRFPDLASTVRERILVEAQGNPLALLELPAALGPGIRASASALPSTLPLGRRLQALFRSRITKLPRASGRLLLRMALDGTGDVRVLEAGAGSNAGFRDLAPAENARLAYLDETTHRLAFHHPLIRSTVVELSHAEDRRAAHRVLADAWSDQPDRQAWHLAEAAVEPDESVAAQLEAAAARILARGDAVGCVKALTRSSELSPRSADRRRRAAAAAYIGADVAGDLANASRVLADLRRGDTDLEGSLQAALAASAFLMNSDGDIATAHRLLVEAIEGRLSADDGTDPLFEEALNTLMMVCYYGGTPDLWRPFHEIAEAVRAPLAVIQHSKTYADPVRTALADIAILEAEIEGLAQETDPTRIVRTGIAAVYIDRMGGCREALWRVVRDARQGGALASGLNALIILAYDDWFTGEWDEADELLAEAVRLADSLGYGLLAWPAKLVQALIASARGDDRRTEEFNAVVEWARPRGFGAVELYAWQARGLAALGRGDFEEAYQQAILISPPGILASHVSHAVTVLMDVVESAVRTGRHAEAAAHVAAMQAANLSALSSRLALVVGACAAMVEPDDTGLPLLEATLALPRIERWQFDRARVRLVYGERLRRSRRMTEARVQLNAALETFERLGARPWVERTTAELRATGQSKPRAGDNVLDRLTPQEFEIVTLAAGGMTNKQIAERLFLSHRTVGGHLHRAFPKLSVATRAGLRDALETLPPEQLPRT